MKIQIKGNDFDIAVEIKEPEKAEELYLLMDNVESLLKVALGITITEEISLVVKDTVEDK